MRKLLTVVAVLASSTALAQSSRSQGVVFPFPFLSEIIPQGAGTPPIAKVPELVSEVRGWTFSGDGYELVADDLATYRVSLLRSRPGAARAPAATLAHRENAVPWRGVKLVLRGELRAGMIDGQALLVLRVEDGAGKVLGEATSAPLAGTSAFTWRRAELLIPETAERVVAAVVLKGSGGVYVRELHLDDAELLASR